MKFINGFNILYEMSSDPQLTVLEQPFKTWRISVIGLFNMSRDGAIDSRSPLDGHLAFEKFLANLFFRTLAAFLFDKYSLFCFMFSI